jgi:predicted metalloprotease with PDZ domain
VRPPSLRGRRPIPVFLCISFFFAFSFPTNATIRYEVSLAHPEQHLFHVTMTIPDVTGEVSVQMAAWDALYQIRDFSSRVQQVEAFVGSEKGFAEKIDKQTWRIKGTGTIKISYAIYWDEAGPFASQLNSEHAFINPAMILMYVPERRGEAVHLAMPDVPERWQATGASIQFMESMGRARNFSGDATSYDALVDAPIEAGKFEEFQLRGIKPEIWVVVHGDSWRKKQVEEDLKRICEYELRLMEGAPFERYTFILHLGKGAAGSGGGMEHSNSTAISAPSDEYLPAVAAHEFFHLWNVKRIRPATLEPVDRTREMYTRALWFAEGVTNTYGSYTLVRSGIWNKEQFYGDLGEQITELEGRPANRWQSAEQSSLDAWFEKYSLYNQPEYSVSYYTKGQVLGDLLDILIRERTNNEKSLDDVLRSMNTEFAKQGKTYRDSLDVERTTEKIVGGSFEEFFQKYVAGSEPFPYREIFGLAGLQLHTAERTQPALGFFADHEHGGPWVVRTVEPAGFAAQAGLRAGDVILNWNGGEVPRRLERWLHEQKPGDVLRLRVRREDKEVSVEFQLGEAKESIYEVSEASGASEKARNIREGLLHGVTSTVSVH